MAITPGWQRGSGVFQPAGAEAVAPTRLGNSASSVYTGTAVTLTLPTDAQGNAYAAYRFAAACAYWVGYGTAATVGGAGCYLVTPGCDLDSVPPVGQTTISVIADTGTTIGSFCVIGLY